MGALSGFIGPRTSRGGSGGSGSVRIGSGSKSKSVNPLSSLAKLYAQLKDRQAPNLAEGFNRSADSLIGAASQAGDQGKAEFLAGGGGRTAARTCSATRCSRST